MPSRALLILLSALLLAACAAKPLEPLPEGLSAQPPVGWDVRQQERAGLQHWELRGKLAVKQESDSGSAVINRWTQQGESYDLALSSAFLGMGRTQLTGTPGFIELTLPDGESYRSGDPQQLIEAATGWRLPIDSLVWWIRGLTAPEGDFRLLFDDNDQLAVIEQQGWEIRYDRWQDFIEGYPPLPARITALKDDKRVRVAVTSWQELER